MSLLYEDRTEILRRCFFDVQNEVGLGRNEEDYHPACKLWFSEHGLPVISKPPLRLMLEGEETHVMVPDFVAWDVISVDMNRGRSYLRTLGMRWGVAANFGRSEAHFTALRQRDTAGG